MILAVRDAGADATVAMVSAGTFVAPVKLETLSSRTKIDGDDGNTGTDAGDASGVW